jgi:hypothetical protein
MGGLQGRLIEPVKRIEPGKKQPSIDSNGFKKQGGEVEPGKKKSEWV